MGALSMTPAVPSTTCGATAVDTNPFAALPVVRRHVHDALAALANEDLNVAATEASSLLGQVEVVVDQISALSDQDRESWIVLIALRDNLSGYLLAASTLEETGVAPSVIVAMLERGAVYAEQTLTRLDTPRPPAPSLR